MGSSTFSFHNLRRGFRWRSLPGVGAVSDGTCVCRRNHSGARGIGLFVRPTIRIAAAFSGIMLLLLTAFFYVPIFALEIHTELAVEGLNYVGDTLLFAATALLAGFGADVARD